MKTYIAKTGINFGRVVANVLLEKRFEAGDQIELDDAEAAPLLGIKAIEEHDPKVAFQEAVRTAERAGRELEQAGIDPSEAAHELRVQERQALDEAIAASAALVAAGAMSIDNAADQICAQLASAKREVVVTRLEEAVGQLKLAKEQEEAGARGTEPRASAENTTDAKAAKKKK